MPESVVDIQTKLRVYLSIADRQLEGYIGERDYDDDTLNAEFDRSLILNILFQPQGVLITDILCAISGGLANHVRPDRRRRRKGRSEYSLFEAALEDENMLVRPSFRDPKTYTFTDALKMIRAHGIQGVRDDAEHTMELLQAAAERNPAFAPCHPTEHLGATFDDLLTERLQTPQPPVIGPSFSSGISQGELQRLWTLSERFRMDCLDEARKRSIARGDRGARRGDIMNAVADWLDPREKHRVDDIRTLPRFSDTPELRMFFQYVNELYLYNHAQQLGATSDLPVYDDITATGIGQVAVSPRLVLPQEATVLAHSVEFPTLRGLRQIRPSELLKIRDQEGRRYFQALQAWHTQDAELTRARVKQELTVYAEKLCHAAKEANSDVLRIVTGPTGRILIGTLNGLVVAGYGLYRASHPQDHSAAANVYLVLGLSGVNVGWCAAYFWLTHTHNVEIRLRRSPEVVVQDELPSKKAADATSEESLRKTGTGDGVVSIPSRE